VGVLQDTAKYSAELTPAEYKSLFPSAALASNEKGGGKKKAGGSGRGGGKSNRPASKGV
jgi:hypothetical protein